jgi:hypothetical protein
MVRAPLFIAVFFMLAGCVEPQKVEKARADAAAFQAERQAREATRQCSETAMPGTTEHLACRLAKTKSAP